MTTSWPFLLACFEHDLGAVHVRLDRPDRRLDDELDADGGGEMEHDVGAIDQLGRQRLVHHRVDDVVEAGTALEVGDVVHRTRRQVVDDDHAVALREERLGQMRSDEPGAAGEQRLHEVNRTLIMRHESVHRLGRSAVELSTHECQHFVRRTFGGVAVGAHAVLAANRGGRVRLRLADRSIIHERAQRPSSDSPVRGADIAPASTNGCRLFGRPMTSAGSPSTSPSIATVEFIVTTASAAASSRARSAFAGAIDTFGADCDRRSIELRRFPPDAA